VLSAPAGDGSRVVKVRRGVPGDAEEVVRLRELMSETVFGVPVPEGPWHDESIAMLREWLADPEAWTAVFVVDAPDGPGLAASVIGVITQRLPSPTTVSGRCGYVYGVCTDGQYRRRGFSRAAMLALLDWFESHGVRRVELHASEYGEALYRELGFVDDPGVPLTRRQ
jgi:GNAT superfamily N-acetyltransferase